MIIHLLPNSHLDPVWLWDWKEGLNEGFITCRSILKLMKEFPDLTYLRGESAIYQHIQEHDPETFSQIRQMIEAGRWDVIGGTFVQPDTNLPATESLVRQFSTGLHYFRREFNLRPTVAWAADSFGHSAGLPEIMASAGMTAFAFSRPMEHDYHLPKPAFWWESPSGKRILCWRIPVGWYGTNRDEMPRRLDETLSRSESWGIENIAVFLGLGNHGGGPSRRHLLDIQAWREKNPQVEVRFSTLHSYFDCLKEEADELPVIRGELNYTLRGCYSSGARFKYLYRKTENLLLQAERTAGIISATLRAKRPFTAGPWRSLLFNAFHDILPGSSIERAMEDQIAWTGCVWHEAQKLELSALNTLASSVDTTVEEPAPDMPAAVPLIVWNPHPTDFEGLVELEAGLDYRPIGTYRQRSSELPVEVLDARGEPLPFQRLEPENHFTPATPWRVRIVTPLRIPACGWHVVRMAWKDQPRQVDPEPDWVTADLPGEIATHYLKVAATPGDEEIKVYGLDADDRGIRVASYEDRYGAWGGHDGERAADSISKVKEYWRIERVETLEKGPIRVALWVRMTCRNSRLDLTVYLSAHSRRIDFQARLVCDAPGERIKLLLPSGENALFEVPGGTALRDVAGEVPGGRWVRTDNLVFASDAIYNFSSMAGYLCATLVRSCRYSSSIPTDPDDIPWRPYMDTGEHRFKFVLAPADERDPYRLADSIEQAPTVVAAAAHPGSLPKAGSLAQLEPANVQMLAFKPSEEGIDWIIRVQETSGHLADVIVRLGTAEIALGIVDPYEVATWRMIRSGRSWRALRVNADEVTKPEPSLRMESPLRHDAADELTVPAHP